MSFSEALTLRHGAHVYCTIADLATSVLCPTPSPTAAHDGAPETESDLSSTATIDLRNDGLLSPRLLLHGGSTQDTLSLPPQRGVCSGYQREMVPTLLVFTTQRSNRLRKSTGRRLTCSQTYTSSLSALNVSHHAEELLQPSVSGKGVSTRLFSRSVLLTSAKRLEGTCERTFEWTTWTPFTMKFLWMLHKSGRTQYGSEDPLVFPPAPRFSCVASDIVFHTFVS